MKKISWAVLALFFAFGLAACKTTGGIDGDGATTGGIGDGGAMSGDLLGERRVYFDFDSSSLDSESRAIVKAHAAHLVANPRLSLKLEGHCDERGTREYNLALGERRAQAVARLMQALGVANNRIDTVSYGEEKPVASGHNEAAWRQNRRVEIKY